MWGRSDVKKSTFLRYIWTVPKRYPDTCKLALVKKKTRKTSAKPSVRTVGMCVHTSGAQSYNTAQNSSDGFPSCPPRRLRQSSLRIGVDYCFQMHSKSKGAWLRATCIIAIAAVQRMFPRFHHTRGLPCFAGRYDVRLSASAQHCTVQTGGWVSPAVDWRSNRISSWRLLRCMASINRHACGRSCRRCWHAYRRISACR